VPTRFPDGVGEAWWLALGPHRSRESRLALMIDRSERHFTIRTASESRAVISSLSTWLRRLSPPDLSATITISASAPVDLAASSREAAMDGAISSSCGRSDVTIGSATVKPSGAFEPERTPRRCAR